MRLYAFAASAALAAAVVFAPVVGRAQDQQTLADIRQELTVLHVEIQRLKRELSTTGAPGTNLSGSTVLDRVGAIENALQGLTSQTERLQHRIDRVVADGTNRIGDLEFRLVELEGGDISQLGETSTLGGETENAQVVGQPPVDTSDELAVGELADFDAAKRALGDGNYQDAAARFASFDVAYPGSPLAAEAHYNRGKALDGLGDTREAARAYLASFTGNSTGVIAPEALFELGAALGRLGQASQACVTLSEVKARFPDTAAVQAAEQEMASLSCS